jgi:hypothetical protein
MKLKRDIFTNSTNGILKYIITMFRIQGGTNRHYAPPPPKRALISILKLAPVRKSLQYLEYFTAQRYN